MPFPLEGKLYKIRDLCFFYCYFLFPVPRTYNCIQILMLFEFSGPFMKYYRSKSYTFFLTSSAISRGKKIK